jgi:hypothetical protein
MPKQGDTETPPVPTPAPTKTNNLFASLADKEEHLAIKASIEVSTMQLNTINLLAVEDILFSVTREARNILLGIPIKIADAVAAESDVFKVKRLLIDAIEDALAGLGDSERVMNAIKDASLGMLDGKMKKSVGGGE